MYKRIIRYSQNILFALAIAGIGILWYHMHIYKLNEIPYEMYIDEFGIGYDSYSLLNYGVDRWLMKYPVYLNNYDSGSSIAYAVLCAMAIKIFGNTSTFAIRFPAAFISAFSMIFIYLITREIEESNRKWFPLASAAMFNILPYFTMQSRVALDCNLMLFAILAIIYFLYRALKRNTLSAWILAGIVTGAGLYTYILSWLVIPVMVFIFLIYATRIGKLNIKKIAGFCIPFIILAFPLFLCGMINLFGLDSMQLGFMTIPRLLNDRKDELIFGNIFETMKSFFRTVFWGDEMALDSIYGYFTLYTISIPFVVIGMVISAARMVMSYKNKKMDIIVIVNAALAAEMVLGVVLGPAKTIGQAGINVYRINAVFGPMLIYLMTGILYVYQACSYILLKLHFPIARYLRVIPIIILSIIYIDKFEDWDEYWFHTKIPAQYCFAAPLDDVVAFFGDDFFTKNVHLDVNYAQMLLAAHVSPYDFNAPELERVDINIKEWRNMKFDVYGEFGVVDENAIYVVYKEHTEFIEYFSTFPFHIFETERYICFYN